MLFVDFQIDSVDDNKNVEVSGIWIEADELTSKLTFNVFLTLHFILNVSVAMPKFIALDGKFVPWKGWGDLSSLSRQVACREMEGLAN